MNHVLFCLLSIVCLMFSAFPVGVLHSAQAEESVQSQAVSTAEKATLRHIAQGELTGKVAANGALVWLGIPFAEPPMGDLRWKAPRPPKPWTGRFAATQYCDACFQSSFLAGGIMAKDGFIGSEDCLYLNVYAPGNVTIFGESAGAVNVLSLLGSPRAKGLFHRAIAQSGVLQKMPLYTMVNYSDDAVPGSSNSAKEVVNKILIRDGKAGNRTEAKAKQMAMSDQEIRQLLYSQTPAQIYKIMNPTGMRLYPAPRLFGDGYVLSVEPEIKAFETGMFNKVPLIIGTNRDERRTYLFNDSYWGTVLATDPGDYVRFTTYGSMAWKQRGVDDIARAMKKGGHHDLYVYRFDWDEQGMLGTWDMSVAIGAGHTVEIPFVFGQEIRFLVPLGNKNIPARRALSASMMSYWTEFAYRGNPGTGRDGGEVRWKPWNSAAGAEKMIIFDTPADGGIRMSSEEVTQESLKQDILNDRTFTDQCNHCKIYKAIFGGKPVWSDEEYRKLGREGCEKCQ